MEVVVFAHALYKELRQRQSDISDALVNGLPKDMEGYRGLVGELRGLVAAEDLVKALLEKHSTDGDSEFPS